VSRIKKSRRKEVTCEGKINIGESAKKSKGATRRSASSSKRLGLWQWQDRPAADASIKKYLEKWKEMGSKSV
jgi:hypothetical protein